MVSNRGSQTRVNRVYLNGREVDVYGLVHGDSLPDGRKLGTSVSTEGLLFESGETGNIYVWVGSELFSSGTQVVLHFNDPNSVTSMKTITLP